MIDAVAYIAGDTLDVTLIAVIAVTGFKRIKKTHVIIPPFGSLRSSLTEFVGTPLVTVCPPWREFIQERNPKSYVRICYG